MKNAALIHLPARLSLQAGRALAGLFRRDAAWVPTSLAPEAPGAAAESEAETCRRLAFSFAVIALSARVLQAGGESALTRDEYLAFREAFPLEDAESGRIRRLFALAWREQAGADWYARRIQVLYPENRVLKREVLRYLSAVARADGPLKPGELRVLEAVAAEFSLGRLALGRILTGTGAPDPKRVLGLPERPAPEQVKSRYRDLMRRVHPDRFATAHYPETRAVAERRAAAVNEAYRALAG